jgi:gliding motility-associated-like protein
LGRPSYKTKLKNAICDLPGSITFNVTTNPELYDVEFRSVIYPSTYTFENLSAGNYYFKILKKDGCIANEATVNLKLDSCNPVTFPNTFSPNGDGNNDIFKPNQDSRATRYQLDIFSRYGRMLFSSRSLTNGWDGQINGSMAPTGVYYWVVSYINDVGKPITQNGYITLIK